MEAEQLQESSLTGASRKRVILLLLKDQADLKAKLGADLKTASAIRINKQSPGIEGGVNVGNEILTLVVIRNVRARE